MVDDMALHDLQQVAQGLAQERVGPKAVETGVGFEHVQQGVHALRAVWFLVAQAHIGDAFPVAGAGFEVAAKLHIGGLIFQQVEEFLGQFQAFLRTAGGVVFGQPIDGECLGVGLFARAEGRAAFFHCPVDSAILLIPEGLAQVIVGVAGHGQVFRPRESLVSCREGPQDARA